MEKNVDRTALRRLMETAADERAIVVPNGAERIDLGVELRRALLAAERTLRRHNIDPGPIDLDIAAAHVYSYGCLLISGAAEDDWLPATIDAALRLGTENREAWLAVRSWLLEPMADAFCEALQPAVRMLSGPLEVVLVDPYRGWIGAYDFARLRNASSRIAQLGNSRTSVRGGCQVT